MLMIDCDCFLREPLGDTKIIHSWVPSVRVSKLLNMGEYVMQYVFGYMIMKVGGYSHSILR